MMQLTELLTGLVQPDETIKISGLAIDSREVKPGDLFIALNGAEQHGLSFYQQAVQQGAKAIVYDPAGEGRLLAQDITAIPCYAVIHLDQRLGEIAARFYDFPSRQLTVIGVTGTNGKTSCSQFLAQMLPDCGVIGTLGWGRYGDMTQTANTTPDALTVQRILNQFRKQGWRYAVMEVSSHGLAQGRVNGVEFDAALFTNLSRDHLDYHGSMERYLAEKMKLFQWPGLDFIVLNSDDPASQEIVKKIAAVKTWAVGQQSVLGSVDESVSICDAVCQLTGIQFDLVWRKQAQTINSRLAGQFTIENLAAVATVLLALGWSLPKIAKKIVQLKPVPGRMETLGGDGKPLVVIDYAHTPDALAKLLQSIKADVEQVTVVFGCGGDRDKGKRAQMGEIACQWAERVIVTNDNPRLEAEEKIIDDILQGCDLTKTEVVMDREAAIRAAVASAHITDCIVIAGKGHEQYQDSKGMKKEFSDQAVARQALSEYRQ
jgi:UDP-N-acetylmuramoyl-L-alanyl-D-glutamate--2,6-diaminopimelate ligase